METTIIITTINKPIFIEDLCININTYEHDNVDIIIIGDIKTPPLEDYCKSVAKKYGMPIEYLNVTSQERELPKPLLDIIPYNTPDRTILGGMLAYFRGTERIIAIDDDNFPTDSDFVGFHSITQTKPETTLIKSDTGWFNIYDALDEECNIPLWPRGYPWGQRSTENDVNRYNLSYSLNVIVNQGLILGDSDVDAISRLFSPTMVTGMNSHFDSQFALYPGTWAPFNYQNTCLSREMIPLYYRPRCAKRNSDIWTSYLYNKLAEHFGDVITFGEPLVKQVRNEHNLWDDLDLELENNRETDYFCQILKAVKLTKATYFEALVELIDKVKIDDEYAMTKKFFEEYGEWVKTITKIL